MMKRRILLSRGLSGCLGALLCLSPAVVEAQAAGEETATTAAEAFRTPWGDPDLGGVWASRRRHGVGDPGVAEPPPQPSRRGARGGHAVAQFGE